MSIDISSYGGLPDGREVKRYTLDNGKGCVAELLDFGALLIGMRTPDRDGTSADITLGYDSLERWVDNPFYLGATVGRYGNRIANGKFSIDGVAYELDINNGPNNLHGGFNGFNKKLWSGAVVESADGDAVRFAYTSVDGEERFPGTLNAAVTYTLGADNTLRIDFDATTDKATVVNLVHHTYWNLTGDPSRNHLDHEMTIHAESYLPVNDDNIPLDGPAPVEGTAFDFRRAKPIGTEIESLPHGYDHNFCLANDGALRPAAEVYEPTTGRVMRLETDQPGVQFYTAWWMDGSAVGRGGVSYGRYAGFCLETQRWPDSPNRPDFPGAVLRPGEVYRHAMVHRFSVR